MAPSDPHAMNTPDMAPIIAALKRELDAGVRRIHIWDLHTDASAHQIWSSPELQALIGQYGRPLYVMEDASGGTKTLLDQLPSLDAKKLHDGFVEALADSPRENSGTSIAHLFPSSRRQNKVR